MLYNHRFVSILTLTYIIHSMYMYMSVCAISQFDGLYLGYDSKKLAESSYSNTE